MIFAGIDPGATGGIAWIDGSTVTFVSMPKTLKGILGVLQTLDTGWTRVAMELVTGYVGGVGQPGSAMFNFGHNAGALEGMLTALGLDDFTGFKPLGASYYVKVRPQEWQRTLGITPKRKTRKGVVGETKTEWKNRLKAEAERVFPSLKPTLATADALLLAHYARITYGGQS